MLQLRFPILNSSYSVSLQINYMNYIFIENNTCYVQPNTFWVITFKHSLFMFAHSLQRNVCLDQWWSRKGDATWIMLMVRKLHFPNFSLGWFIIFTNQFQIFTLKIKHWFCISAYWLDINSSSVYFLIYVIVLEQWKVIHSQVSRDIALKVYFFTPYLFVLQSFLFYLKSYFRNFRNFSNVGF